MEINLSEAKYQLLDIYARAGKKAPGIRNRFEAIEKKISEVPESLAHRAGFAVQGKPDRRSTIIKKQLLSDMQDAFRRYGHVPHRPMATYRSIAEILKAFGVQHQQDGDYTSDGVKRVVLQSFADGETSYIKQIDGAIDQVIGKSK